MTAVIYILVVTFATFAAGLLGAGLYVLADVIRSALRIWRAGPGGLTPSRRSPPPARASASPAPSWTPTRRWAWASPDPTSPPGPPKWRAHRDPH